MAWAPDYVTVQQLADYLRIGDDDDDVELALAVSAASRAVDRATGRQFGLVAAPEARYYTAFLDNQTQRWCVETDDVMIVTGAEVASDPSEGQTFTTTLTTYDWRPANAAPKSRPYTKIVFRPGLSQPNDVRDATRVTARWGWSSVPDTVEEATLLQASRFFKRREAPFGIAGSPETGSEMRLLAKVDPDVQLMLSGYVRWWGAR